MPDCQAACGLIPSRTLRAHCIYSPDKGQIGHLSLLTMTCSAHVDAAHIKGLGPKEGLKDTSQADIQDSVLGTSLNYLQNNEYRGARAARVVAVTRAVNFALDYHAVTAVAVVAGNEERQQAGDEEENAVPGVVSHGALAIDVEAIPVARDSSESQINAVRAVGRPVGAIRVGNAAQAVDAADERAHEQKVDKGNKLGRVPCARIQKQRADRPCRSQYRDYEEHQNRPRRQQVAVVVPCNEPGEHAQGGNQRDDLEDAPEDERKPGNRHFDGVWLLVVFYLGGLAQRNGVVQAWFNSGVATVLEVEDDSAQKNAGGRKFLRQRLGCSLFEARARAVQRSSAGTTRDGTAP
ncbi:hypothetical protein OPT61_g4444 [Boeremia exigua]|uniref:Uncharacterized protein n=1 Tax=Boeremia exigua TaxID=749465 RepID=A0ACC2IE73_9PLEO|nr:hypothetical protein OPT61_g4444 [Boeremia exigua]